MGLAQMAKRSVICVSELGLVKLKQIVSYMYNMCDAFRLNVEKFLPPTEQ